MADLSKTYEEMVSLCSRRGSHYFTPETIRFWGGKVHDSANKWGLFIESFDNFDRTRKLFAVKFIGPDGYITSVEPAEQGKTYEHFATYEDAKAFRHKMTIALNKAAKSFRESKVLETLCTIEEEELHTGIYILTNATGESIKVNTNDFERFICG